MNAAQQRILTAAEQRMGTAGTVARTVDQAETLARWGLSSSPVSQMPPADVLALSRMFAGDFPATMTPDDVSEFGKIEKLFEEACQ